MRVRHRSIVAGNLLSHAVDSLQPLPKENREKQVERLSRITDKLSIQEMRWLEDFILEADSKPLDE